MSTLHCTLENGADLYVNERQKIRRYRARSTEERRMPNRDFNFFYFLNFFMSKIIILVRCRAYNNKIIKYNI